MDIQFYGANCVSITTPNARAVIDDNLSELGAKSVIKENDILLCTNQQISNYSAQAKLVITSPGEYEIADLSVHGIPVRAHTDESDVKTATMYKLSAKDVDILVTGHVYPELSEAELEDIGNVDVLIVPVGGNGYTTDAVGALQLIKTIEPKLVVPVHYADKALTYPVPQKSLDDALKELSMEVSEKTKKLRVKAANLPEDAKLVVIEH